MKLTLFLPRHFSLAHWERVGLYDYSTALYRHLAGSGHDVTFVTWGGPSEGAYAPRLPGIRILYNRWKLPAWRYERWLPWLHWRALSRSDVIKSFQVDGADVAYRAARVFRKPFIARCGYLLSDFAVRRGDGEKEIDRARKIEAIVFANADRSVVTTESMKRHLLDHYRVSGERIRVIPNFVDIENFSPDPMARVEGRITFVGRLERQKNVLALVEACRGLDVEVAIVGMGSLQAAVAELARQQGTAVRLLGVRSHDELPALLRQSTLFALPTSYEGHPKALIEAMACGLPVLAGDVAGVNDLIEHGRTGWLCGTDVPAIRSAIVHLMGDAGLRERLGNAARKTVVERFSFAHAVALEEALLRELAAGARRSGADGQAGTVDG